MKAAETIQRTENEINFLKDELENERRKSQADQARINKMERMIGDKEKQLEKAQDDFLSKDKNIRKLEQALDDERRKSMLDEQRIRELESQIEQKYNEANENYQNYLALQRKSELTQE